VLKITIYRSRVDCFFSSVLLEVRPASSVSLSLIIGRGWFLHEKCIGRYCRVQVLTDKIYNIKM